MEDPVVLPLTMAFVIVVFDAVQKTFAGLLNFFRWRGIWKT
jgi:hypothetical protein